MLLKYKGTQETDSIMLRYNIDNAHLIMQSVIDMIDRKVVSSQDLLIITFYQAQLKLYDRSLGHLFLTLATAHMTAIKISTVNNV